MSETRSNAKLARLSVAMDANAAAYRRAVQTSAPGDCWDFVVLTAANEKQAQGYRQELALRERAVGPTGAFFPAIQKSVVVADPPGRRAGSGGATLGVMRALVDEHHVRPEDFANLRILLIHSGGASQRLPAYSPLGKIFAPLPLLRPDGQIATLFDHLYLTLAGLPERLGAGMLILAGDVFLLFDHRHVHTPPPGVTALTMRVDAETGRGHGVFVTGKDHRITGTLQKVSVETMLDEGAADAHGRVLIDTGLLFFDPQRTQLLARLAGGDARWRWRPALASSKKKRGRNARATSLPLHERFKTQLDLYEDMTAALATGTQHDSFISASKDRAMRRELWRALHGIPFQVMELDGQFLHLGTTRQFRDAMIGQNPSPAAELFQQDVLAHCEWTLEAGRRVYHSVLLADHERSGTLGAGSVVEHSILRAPSRIGAGCVVSQVFAFSKPIDLGDNLLFFQVPVRAASGKLLYVHVLCGVEDDFKGSFRDGKCRYLNEPIDEWLARHRITPRDVWGAASADPRTLWTAKLFVGTETRDAASVALALSNHHPANRRDVETWRKSPRFSMAMILEQADPVSLIEHREVVSAFLQASELRDRIRRREDVPVESLMGHYSTDAAYRACERLLTDWSNENTGDAGVAIDQARAIWCVAQLLQRPDHPNPTDARPRIGDVMNGAFAKVAEGSETGHLSIQVSPPRDSKLQPGVEITAAAPVRLDLAGGWSDTPPYCFERGGHVVNVAINLDGRPPVRAIVRTTREPRLLLDSHDLGQQIEIKTLDRADGIVDVRDPFALHKIALQLAGLLPTEHRDVTRHLKQLGAGLHIVTECRVPKGSGLGTSSILAAALLAALQKLRAGEASASQLIEQTLLLEQRLSTGGGWQDQIGGIVGGVKSTITAPGIPQRPVIEPLTLSDATYEALQERLVVYYSGQQRLARDILRRVMGRWLGREPTVLLLMEELKQSAAALRTAILKAQWPTVGREIARYWRIKKDLYPGSTTPTIDVLFLELRDLCLAAGLAGAGGGGFAYFLCKDARQAKRLRDELTERSARPGSLGGVYQTEINRTGLTVSKKRST